MQKKYEIRITPGDDDGEARARKLFDVNRAAVVEAKRGDGFTDFIIEIDEEVFSVMLEALLHSGLGSETWTFPKAESQERARRAKANLYARHRSEQGTTRH